MSLKSFLVLSSISVRSSLFQQWSEHACERLGGVLQLKREGETEKKGEEERERGWGRKRGEGEGERDAEGEREG